MPRIGELLIAEGILSEGAVRSALGFQRHTGEPFRLGTILLDRDLLAEESLLKALSAIHRCDYATWPQILKAGPQIVRILPERAAVRLAAVPYALEGRGVRVAFKACVITIDGTGLLQVEGFSRCHARLFVNQSDRAELRSNGECSCGGSAYLSGAEDRNVHGGR